MTVRENIAFPLKLRKMDKAEIDQRVEQAAEILDITENIWTASPRLFPAASVSAWLSAAPSSGSRRSC